MDLKIAQQMTITELVLENQKLKLDVQREAEHHDRMVGELEKVYKERDEAKDQLSAAKHFLEKYIAERDNAIEKAERYRIDANTMMLQRDKARFALQELWQFADPHLPQIDEEQSEKWHQAMFGDSDKFLKLINERNDLVQKLDAWQEIAEHLHHLVQHPAYGVDQAIRRMDVLEAYKHLKNEH